MELVNQVKITELGRPCDVGLIGDWVSCLLRRYRMMETEGNFLVVDPQNIVVDGNYADFEVRSFRSEDERYFSPEYKIYSGLKELGVQVDFFAPHMEKSFLFSLGILTLFLLDILSTGLNEIFESINEKNSKLVGKMLKYLCEDNLELHSSSSTKINSLLSQLNNKIISALSSLNSLDTKFFLKSSLSLIPISRSINTSLLQSFSSPLHLSNISSKPKIKKALLRSLIAPPLSLLLTSLSKITGLVFSRYHSTLISSDDSGTLSIWSVTSHRPVHSLSLSSSLHLLCISPAEPIIITASLNNEIHLFNLQLSAFIPRCKFTTYSQKVHSIQFSPNGTYFLVLTINCSLRLFNSKTSEFIFQVKIINQTNFYHINCCQFIMEELLAVGNSVGVIKYIKSDNGNIAWEEEAHKGYVNIIRYHEEKGLVVSYGQDLYIKLWENEGVLYDHYFHKNAVEIACIGGQVYSGDEVGGLIVYDIEGKTVIRRLVFNYPKVVEFCFCKEGLSLSVFFSDESGGIARINEDCSIDYFNSHHRKNRFNENLVRLVCVNSSIIASFGCDGYFKLWDKTRLECIQIFSNDTTLNIDTVAYVKFSIDSSLIALADIDGNIRIYSTITHSLLAELYYPSGHVSAIEISEDLKFLIVGNFSGGIQIWDIFRCELLADLKESSIAVKSISSYDKYFYFRRVDGEISLGNLHSREIQNLNYDTHSEEYTFSFNKKFFIVVSRRTAKLYKIVL